MNGHTASRRALAGVIVLGIALRLLAVLSWWPVSTTLEDGYQRFAANPFSDPQHPAGYDAIVGALGHVSRQVAVTVLLQHVVGILSALMLAAAVRRLSGSPWAAVAAAATILLGADQIFLEHAVMSETWATLTIVASLYAAVRSIEEPVPWWRWPLLTGAALAAAVAIRTASLPLAVVVAGVLVAVKPRRHREHLRAAAVLVAAAAVLLVAYAAGSSAAGQRFGIAPSPGWYLYGRAAQFAECGRFAPPAGTRGLCESRPTVRRPSGYFYTFEPGSPALRRFGAFGRDDGLVGAWARAAVLAQPLDFLGTAWAYLRSYYVPSSLPARLRATSTALDPQLDFTNSGNAIVVSAQHKDLEGYYAPFDVHPKRWGLRFLHDWQRVLRFGATALFITTLLTLLGLAVASGERRAAIALFGLGGLSLLLAPVLTGTYAGRYTVPMAGLMVAAAVLSLQALWERRRRRA